MTFEEEEAELFTHDKEAEALSASTPAAALHSWLGADSLPDVR